MGVSEGQPSWRVLLIGGASGVGKTQVSYRLARHYGVGITEVDDFQIVLERMTTPEQYPPLHYWRTHFDEALRMDDQAKLDHMIAYATVMAEALTPVIANHVEYCAPVVLEGDFILPSLALQPGDSARHVRGLFLYEADEGQILSNYLQRGEQPDHLQRRARSSWRYSEWLRAECARLGVPAIPARPWETVLERAIATIDGC